MDWKMTLLVERRKGLEEEDEDSVLSGEIDT